MLSFFFLCKIKADILSGVRFCFGLHKPVFIS